MFKKSMLNQKYKVIEFFAGIGGVTGGFLDTGYFEPVLLNDLDPKTKKAFIRNFPKYKDKYTINDIKDISVSYVKEFTEKGCDGILGCPPCQGFSMAGLRRKDDPRNSLIIEFQRLLEGLEPKFFVMENVPGLLNSRYFQVFKEKIGFNYNIDYKVLNAAEYGVPQYRKRAVIVGFHKDLNVSASLPEPSHGGKGKVFDYFTGKYLDLSDDETRKILKLERFGFKPPKPLVTLKDALGDIPEFLSPGEEKDNYTSTPFTHYQKLMRKKTATILTNHQAWNHGKEIILKLSKIKPGDSPENEGRRNRNTKYFSQAYSRLHPDGLSRTLTTNFANPGGGRYTHYSCPRTITIREALRIQSFPDDFIFDRTTVSPTDAKRMIGNAFPRLLAKKIADHVHANLQ